LPATKAPEKAVTPSRAATAMAAFLIRNMVERVTVVLRGGWLA
jgi:hypothetical protein